MELIRSVIVCIMLLLCGPVSGAWASVPDELPPAGNSPANETRIVMGDFGYYDSESEKFVPSRIVPLKSGQIYGWYIMLDTDKAMVKWREEFTLPEAPVSWGEGGAAAGQKLSADRRVSITEREVAPEEGIIHNTWEVAPGDPKGRYVIRVIVDGRQERVFEFDVK